MSTRMSRFNLVSVIAALTAATTIGVPNRVLASNECEGNACGVVSRSWDAGSNCHRFRNRSDRNVRVELRNWGATNSLDLDAGESACAYLKMFEMPYKANFR